MLSPLLIIRHCLFEHVLAKITAQVFRSTQVCLAPQEERYLPPQARHPKQSRDVFRFELDQDVHVAIRLQITMQGRAEDRQGANMMAAAKLGDSASIEMDLHGSDYTLLLDFRAGAIGRMVLHSPDHNS